MFYTHLVKYDEFLIQLDCMENMCSGQILREEDFSASEMTTINNYINFQEYNFMELENHFGNIEVFIHNNINYPARNLVYDYNDLDVSNKTIVDDFYNLLVSKAAI